MSKKGLVSFSLFGNDPMYTVGALRNVGIWQDSPFDVDLRFYVSNWVNNNFVDNLLLQGVDVVRTDGPEDQTATFWRFQALNSDYDYYLIRDVDSRPNEREFYAISEWLDSGRAYHVIRDHPYHGVAVLAGLWGVTKDRARQAYDQLLPLDKDYYKIVNRACNHLKEGYESNDFYQIDQWVLRLKLYPLMKSSIIAHDEFFGFERKMFKRNLPLRPDDLSFIGEGFDEFDQPRYPEHRDLIKGWPRRLYR